MTTRVGQGQRTTYRTCPLCEATCGLEITVSGDQVVRIRGDKDDVFSRGFICPKGSTLTDLHTDPDRLRTPMVKTEEGWKEVSWDEAFSAAAAGLQSLIAESGNDSVAVYLGNPTVHGMAGPVYAPALLKSLKSKNFFSAATVDQMPKHVSSGFMFGHPDLIPVPDIDRTDFLLMLGANPYASNGSLATAPDWPGRMKAIQERGGQIVTVDPRRTKTAAASDEHLFITPGTDALWLYAIANVIIDEDLVDLGRLASCTQGLETFAASTLGYTPEAVAERTGIDADTTRRIARAFATASSAVAYGRIGTHTTEFGTLASWLVDVLNAITGNLDEPGGAMFPLAAHSSPRDKRGFKTGRWLSRAAGLPEVRGELPVAALVSEIETPGDGQVKGLITVAGNPALSIPDSDRTAAALENLEFMVSVDIYINETTRHANVILPPPSPLERAHYDFAFYTLAAENVANYSPSVFDKPADAPAEWEIIAKLAAIVSGAPAETPVSVVDDLVFATVVSRATTNPASPVFGQDPEAIIAATSGTGPERVLDFLLRAGPYGEGYGALSTGLTLEVLLQQPHGVHFGPLVPRLPDGLATPDAQVHLAPDALIDDSERLRSSLETRIEPLLLIGRRDLKSNNSWMHNIDRLTRTRNKCTLIMHPKDAAQRGLSEDQVAAISSDAGSIDVPIEISDDIMEGVVSLPHGWGHDLEGSQMAVAASRPGANSNILASTMVDPMSGNARLNAIPVTVGPST
jgi:anaerobic selenocysteine-containing dehydrogenase